jgi:N-acetylmuramoyl-L-alanine amidase
MQIIQDYLPVNRYSRPGLIRSETLGIVVHWTNKAGQPAAGVVQYFKDLAAGIDPNPYDEIAQHIFASTQGVVGLQGEVIQTMPHDEVAWQVGSTDEIARRHGFPRAYTLKAQKFFSDYIQLPLSPNYCVVGFEMCHPTHDGHFLEATWLSGVKLAVYYLMRYPNLTFWDIWTHHQVVGWKPCPLWFLENPEEWQRFIDDVKMEYYRQKKAGRTYNDGTRI